MLNYSIYHTEALKNTLEENGYNLIGYDENGTQLNNCQAWTINGYAEDKTTGEVKAIKILQSYNTLVAYVLNGVCVRCGSWSRTTSKQTTQWASLYC